MFSFTVRRKCGHEEQVTVPGLPDGKGLKQYVETVEQEEGEKWCAVCQVEKDKEPPPWVDNVITAFVWSAILLVFSLFCWIIGC